MKKLMARRGFTLIELLVVIGILAVLLAITLVAINPARQFSQSNNTKRSSDVNAILNAVNQYQADNRGALPSGIPSGVYGTDDEEIGSDTANGQVDLCAALVTQYLAALPVDPLTNNGAAITDCTAAYATGYNIVRSANDNRLTVGAPDAELGATITVTR